MSKRFIAIVIAASLSGCVAAPRELNPIAGSLAAEVGIFFPYLDSPDYVATVKQDDVVWPPEATYQVIRRSGPWVRIVDARQSAQSGLYISLSTGSLATYIAAEDTEIGARMLGLRRIETYVTGAEIDVGPMEQSGSALGRGCSWWTVWRIESGSGQSSCVTEAGTELRSEIGTQGDVSVDRETTQLEFTSVDQAEVRPGMAVWEIEDWIAAESMAPAAGDFEVVLQIAWGLGEGQTMIIRRRGATVYREETRSASTYMWGRSVDLAFAWSGQVEGGIFTRLDLQRLDETPATEAASTPPDRGPETVLGETCRWGTSANGIVASGGDSECLTDDGIPLVVVFGGRIRREYRAVRINRRSVAPDEVLPPQEIMNWRYWGF